MVVASAAIVAALRPVTEFAMLDWFGIGCRPFIGIEFVFKARFYETVIRQEVVWSKRLGLEFVTRRDDVHSIRHDALHLRQKFRIQTKLQDRAASRFACELCIYNFIRPFSEVTRSINFLQNV